MIESDIAVGASLRITCTKEELVQGLTLVGRAVSSRTAIQILSGILLEARGDELRLAATGMELSLRAGGSGQGGGGRAGGRRQRPAPPEHRRGLPAPPGAHGEGDVRRRSRSAARYDLTGRSRSLPR